MSVPQEVLQVVLGGAVGAMAALVTAWPAQAYFTQRISKLEQLEGEKARRNEALEEEFATASRTIQEAQEVRIDMARLDQIRSRIDSTNTELVTLEDRASQARFESARLEKVAALRAKEVAQLDQDVEARKRELKSLESVKLEYAEYQSKLVRLQEVKQNIANAQIKHDKLNLAIEKGKVEHARLSATIEDTRAEERKLDKSLRATQAKIASLDALKREHTSVASEVERKRKQLDDLDAQRAKTEQSIAEQGLRAARVHEYEARLEHARAKVEREEERLLELERERVKLDAQVVQLKTQGGLLEDNIQSRRDEVEQLEARLQRIEADRSELKMLEQTIADLREVQKRETQSVEDTRSHLRELQDNVIETEKQLQHAQTQLLKRLPEFQVKLDDADPSEAWKSLREPIFDDADIPNELQEADEAEFLETFSDTLAERGFHYPARVVDAFHASLKISDIASLTVLAGVSGTGKSLLPRLYARHFGLHELVIPIQPRWDSPHDLLGHYNFLERRYRATELSRALWQFERHNRDVDDEGSVNLKDYMLLVLLDEMNLARVEYYFSELLSKLELRGEIDVDDVTLRRRAEIAFDTGQAEAGPRVYPDLNVLFVGTMNEDESTQTLSDKVLDRANVLRFGSPRKFAAAQRETWPGAENAMTFDLWRSWQADEAAVEAADEATREPLQKINRILRRLGRPFGHRVFQSVVRYVANYPVRTDDVDKARKLALSDQLAQRVFPKLRGLDCKDESVHGGFDDIHQVLSGLGDEPTVEAFEVARQGDFFQWTGVVWGQDGS